MKYREMRRCCIIPKNTQEISNLRISAKIWKCNKFNELTAIMQQRQQQFMNQRTTNQGGEKGINSQVLVGGDSVE